MGRLETRQGQEHSNLSKSFFSFKAIHQPQALYVQRAEAPLPQKTPARTVILHPVEAQISEGFPRSVQQYASQAVDWAFQWAVRLWARWYTRADAILLGGAVGLYLLTRLVGLTTYPVFFLGDEAIHTVYAEALIRDGGMFEGKTFLPTYFKNGPKYNLSLSVYVQVLPTLLFGKSIVATRGTSILLTLIPAITLALIVRNFFKLPYGWTATLLLGLAPVWFLHSRTALETVLAVAMYAGFLYFYLRYRLDDPKYLYATLIFGALTFYAYSPAQLVIVVCAGVLFLVDFRYHLQNWQIGWRGLGLLVILTLPYLRFRLAVTDAVEVHLRELGSYWLEPIPFSEKVARFFSLYGYGLSPGYWYFFNQTDLPRHQMGQAGNLARFTLPFALVGVFTALKAVLAPSRIGQRLNHFLQSKTPWELGEPEPLRTRLTYRTLFIALLVAPLPGTLAQVGNTRVLTFVLPITVLTAVGLIKTLQWVALRVKWGNVHAVFAPGLFAVLAVSLGWFTSNAVRHGPFWHQNYGFGGMQYGAQPLFEKINHYLEAYNSIQIVLSPNWANNADFLTIFFLDDSSQIEIASIDAFLIEVKYLAPIHLVILTPQEYEQAQASKKFKTIELVDTVNYPNGEPGFYFLRLAYVDNIRKILAEEEAARQILQEGMMTLPDGTVAQIRYTQLDMGQISQLFDGDAQTFIRTAGINPAVLELTFPEPRPLREVALHIGGEKTQVTAWITTTPEQPPLKIIQIVDGREPPPEKVINFGEALLVHTLRLEILMVERTQADHLHLWDLWLR